MKSIEEVLKKLEFRKVMRAAEFKPYVSTRTQLRRLVDAGKIIALGSGIYAHPSIDPFVSSVIATARYYPKAVISNISALVIHGLSDERVDRIDVDIQRNSSIRNKLIYAHRVPNKNIIGTIQQDYHGTKIRIYSRERALCDAYRLDAGGPIFLRSLKRYVKAGVIDPENIAKFDQVLKTDVLRSLRQELADG